MKRIAAFTAAAAAAALIPFPKAEKTASADTDTIKIMCIGDSITDGYVPEYAGSYRKFIYHGLTEKGYNIDMVGAKDGGYAPTYTDAQTGESFEFDNENTGYSGYAVKAYPGRNGILETLQQTGCLADTQPDIVTLQIGTNNIIDNHDMTENGRDLEELISYILENIPEDSVLFVTGIPDLDPNREGVYDWFGNYRHSADWQTQYDDATAEANIHKAVADYNAVVESVVKEMSASRSNLRAACVQTAITDVKSQLFDGVHPNNDGYRAMGDYWTELLDGYIQGRGAVVTTTATTTTTTTASPYEPLRCRVSDLVLLSRFLLGEEVSPFDEHTIQKYDMCEDGRLDPFDLVEMRRYLVGAGSKPIWD